MTTDDETMPVLERALARTRALGAVPAEERPSADLSRAASDWDEALSSPELLDRIDARLAALRSEADTYDVVDRLEATVTQALGRLAAGAATIEDRTGLLYGTTHVSVDAAFDRLQLLVDDLDARRRADDRLPVEDERDAWLGVCEAYGAIARSGTAEDRFDAFTMLWAPVCDFACWLWNVRWDYALSNAVHRWLLREAEAVDHPEGRELSAKNVACGK